MKLTHDSKHGLLYLQLTPDARSSVQTGTLLPGVFAAFDADGSLIGLEMIGAREVVGPSPRIDVELDRKTAV